MDDQDAEVSEVVSLVDAHDGQRLRFTAVEGGHALRMRLATLGLLPGEVFSLVRNAHPGPVIVEVRGARLLLGRGMSCRIRVRPLSA